MEDFILHFSYSFSKLFKVLDNFRVNGKKINQIEKELINIRLIQIKEEPSFLSKTFFTVLSIIVGAIFLYFKEGKPQLNNYWIAFFLFGVLIFILQVWGTKNDLRRVYDNLMGNVIKSNNLEDYRAKKRSWFDRVMFGISVGYFMFIILLLIGIHFKWSLIFALIFAVIFSIAPRHF